MRPVADPIRILIAGGLLIGGGAVPSLAQTYIVGTGVPPFGFESDSGVQGYSVEVMQAIAEDARFDIEFTVFPAFTPLLPALQDGTIDIAAGPTTITLERIEAGIAFTGPYAQWSDMLVVPATDTSDYNSVREFAGERFGSTSGTIYLNYLTSLQQSEDLFGEVIDVTDATGIPGYEGTLAALRNEAVKGVITASFLRPLFEGESDIRIVESYVPVLNSSGGIAVRQDDLELLGHVQASLSKLIAHGTIGSLAEKWSLTPP